MDIVRKFDEILFRNRIIRKMSYDGAIQIVKELEKNILAGKKVGIYGVGIEAEGLLHFISHYSDELKIDYCFDKTIRDYQYKNVIKSPNVYPIECITEMDVDQLILGSYEYRQTFIKTLDLIGYHGEVIDLFGHLEAYIDDHFTDYKKIFKTRQAYLEADEVEKVNFLKKLIKEYLLLKDFINAFYYIDIYVTNRYPDHSQYENLKKEIDILLCDIKKCIEKRKKKDIIINWVDALSYYDIPGFLFLKRQADEGICFENAYTVMPWTTETTKTILSGEYPIEGKLFLRGDLSNDNTRLLNLLDKNGYEFKYCGMPKFAKLFDGEDIAYIHYFESKFCGSMQKQWDALDILCKSERPQCVLIHTLRETHEPFICGEGDTLQWFGSTKADWQQEACRKQAEISGDYIDKQLNFYEDFYGEDAIKIYMSDHGRVGNSPMDEKKIHIMLSINAKNLHAKAIKGMFSLVQFPDLIQMLIFEEEDWDSLTSDHVRIENLDAYSELAVRDTLSGRLDKKEMYQCRGIVTATDRYFLYAYGKEYYFKDRVSIENEINNPQYRDRINQLKQLCGDEFINIYQYKKFVYSRKLYTDIDIDINKFDFT